MGVPYFFRHVVTSFRGLTRPLAQLPRPRAQRLFIDFNGLIYNAAAQLPSPPREDDVIAATVQSLTQLVAAVEPAELVYVAVDGVCPVAKMEQQRSRRFIAAATTGAAPVPAGHFSSMCATPGTAFMRRLNAALHAWAATAPAVVSDSLEPGEGEHKIMDYLRAHPAGAAGGDLVWGLDADLILLCMLRAPAAIPCVLRDEPDGGGLHVLDVPRLARELAHQGRSSDDPAAFLRDFVALMSLAGNDFLPPLTFVRVGSGGVQTLLRAYHETSELGLGPLVTDQHGLLNTARLAMIVQSLVRLEADGLAALKKKSAARLTALRKESTLSIVSYDPFDSTQVGWRSDYYAHLFPPYVHPVAVAAEYVQALRWVARYYMLGGAAVDWTWAYPYMHSPTCSDLSNHLHCCGDDVECAAATGPLPWLTPELQLVAVLPRGAELLLPARLRRVATDLSLGCAHMYPVKFELDGFLKMQCWQCHARLPRLEVNRLRCAINRIEASPRP